MRKYRIFISGNQKELKDERIAIKEVINNNASLQNLFDVFLFEDLPARGKSPVSTYLKYVDESDVYIGIIGNEYGIKGKDSFSATEREFSRFIKKDSPQGILFFIRGKDDSGRDKETQRFFKTIREMK